MGQEGAESEEHALAETASQGQQPAAQEMAVFKEFPGEFRGLGMGGLGAQVGGPGRQENDRRAHKEQDKHTGNDKKGFKPQPLGHKAPHSRAQAHAGVDGGGVPAVGAPQVGGGGKIRHIRHEGGADGRQAGAEEEIDDNQLEGGGADAEQKGSYRGDGQPGGDKEFAAPTVRKNPQGKGKGPGHQQEGGVDEAHLHGAGLKGTGEERHHGDAHVGAQVGRKGDAAADGQKGAVGEGRGSGFKEGHGFRSNYSSTAGKAHQ